MELCWSGTSVMVKIWPRWSALKTEKESILKLPECAVFMTQRIMRNWECHISLVLDGTRKSMYGLMKKKKLSKQPKLFLKIHHQVTRMISCLQFMTQKDNLFTPVDMMVLLLPGVSKPGTENIVFTKTIQHAAPKISSKMVNRLISYLYLTLWNRQNLFQCQPINGFVSGI